MQPHTLVYK